MRKFNEKARLQALEDMEKWRIEEEEKKRKKTWSIPVVRKPATPMK